MCIIEECTSYRETKKEDVEGGVQACLARLWKLD